MFEIVVKDQSRSRLDRYLRSLYPGLTQGMIEKALRKKDILVKGQPGVKSSYRVIDRDIILVYEGLISSLPKVEENRFTKETQYLAKLLLTRVLFENKDVIIFDKPNGVAVQGGTDIISSLDEALKYINYEYRLTHRIDRETSGIILVAKHREAAIKITAAFAEQKIKKEYLAILVGIPKEHSGRIESYITKKSVSKNFQRVAEDDENGRIAITEYVVKKVFGDKCEVIFSPLTGRMHQLRFHATQLGCYIEGDKKYGAYNQDCKTLKLHASYIKVPEEVLGYDIECHCE